ncbi:hypothetical protein P4C99_07625 [Pontiellaceae bacterium B1224]|nr:hypothetical protein [Pontiellaceae bacterium B1224]
MKVKLDRVRQEIGFEEFSGVVVGLDELRTQNGAGRIVECYRAAGADDDSILALIEEGAYAASCIPAKARYDTQKAVAFNVAGLGISAASAAIEGLQRDCVGGSPAWVMIISQLKADGLTAAEICDRIRRT